MPDGQPYLTPCREALEETPCDGGQRGGLYKVGNPRSCDGLWSQYTGIDSWRTAKERFIKSHGWTIQCNSGNCGFHIQHTMVHWLMLWTLTDIPVTTIGSLTYGLLLKGKDDG